MFIDSRVALYPARGARVFASLPRNVVAGKVWSADADAG